MKLAKPVLYAAVVIVIVVVLAVAYVALSGAQGPVVADGNNISVYYTGTFTNGTVFNSNVGGTPFQFTVGVGQVITGFDQGVIGMHLNQTKTLTIPANEAYGEVNPALILHVPISAFGNRTVQPGMTVTRNASGEYAQGTVTAVNSTNVTIDFNPPLAGYTLVFKITVVGIRKS